MKPSSFMAVVGVLHICLCVSGVIAAPVADFTANVTSGISPLSVLFTDRSLNNPAGWAWYFGDETYADPWTQVNGSAGWVERYSHSSVALPDGSIVLMGGSEYKNDVWRSTDKGTTWTLVNASAGWSGRNYPSSVVMPDGSIVLMGGAGGSNDVWRSTDKGTTWTLVNASAGWSWRYLQSSVGTPDGSIVLMGGEDGNPRNDVWLSTDNGAMWTQMTASAEWSVRELHSSVAMPDGSIVLTGGSDHYGIYMNDVWRSTDHGATWTLVNASAGWSPRSGHSTVVMPDGSIVLMGGYDYNYPYVKNDVWRSKDIGETWTQLPVAGWSPRSFFSSVALPDGSIVLMGGWGGSGDVWRLMPAGSLEQNPVHIYTAPGIYNVSLEVYNTTSGYDSTQKTGYIRVNLPSLPGQTKPPTDQDNDGIFEDLNGNGRLDFADVVLYFNQMTWIAANEPIAAFDLNGNGRIDFADIVALFNEI